MRIEYSYIDGQDIQDWVEGGKVDVMMCEYKTTLPLSSLIFVCPGGAGGFSKIHPEHLLNPLQESGRFIEMNARLILLFVQKHRRGGAMLL